MCAVALSGIHRSVYGDGASLPMFQINGDETVRFRGDEFMLSYYRALADNVEPFRLKFVGINGRLRFSQGVRSNLSSIVKAKVLGGFGGCLEELEWLAESDRLVFPHPKETCQRLLFYSACSVIAPPFPFHSFARYF